MFLNDLKSKFKEINALIKAGELKEAKKLCEESVKAIDEYNKYMKDIAQNSHKNY